MKVRQLAGLTLFILILVLGGTSFAEKVGDDKASAPKAFFPESTYRFESVVDGTEVTHEFIIMNKGDALLEVQSVGTG